ncbi:hypothetical protein ADN00_16720 [Ornatilinea apprima]|uniref:Uridine phosphorylase n=1 Tax=Ornatilinea apprima TaxID=1134406 RepID=A0A0P6XJD4_9CHLR|nr:nucleoside phosphorylase [Ornatilinea apprima]KPL71352.1 hypothetical protein ADN00_16720 [Ornatilinea apprima]
MPSNAPILEFDPAPRAILEPQPFPPTQPIPNRAVLCFFAEVLQHLIDEGRLQPAGALKSEIGLSPYYTLEINNQSILVTHPGVGAPLAAGFLEELIALGVNQFVACGGAGVLNARTHAGHAFVINSAVRDEGVSYHYLPAAREVQPSPRVTAALQASLEEHKVPYELVKTWTTDAIYRETATKRDQRVAEGCEVVEMEAAAFFAVAQFRGVEFGQLLYGGDLVVAEGWDSRAWDQRQDSRSALFWLAVDACTRL